LKYKATLIIFVVAFNDKSLALRDQE